MDKRIEIIELPVSELKTEFGNPRKPLKKKAKEKLKESLDNLGDFGVIVLTNTTISYPDTNVFPFLWRILTLKFCANALLVTVNQN